MCVGGRWSHRRPGTPQPKWKIKNLSTPFHFALPNSQNLLATNYLHAYTPTYYYSKLIISDGYFISFIIALGVLAWM